MLYALSIFVVDPGGGFRQAAGYTLASSFEEAMENCLNKACEKYPTDHGWHNHSCDAKFIDNEIVGAALTEDI